MVSAPLPTPPAGLGGAHQTCQGVQLGAQLGAKLAVNLTAQSVFKQRLYYLSIYHVGHIMLSLCSQDTNSCDYTSNTKSAVTSVQ